MLTATVGKDVYRFTFKHLFVHDKEVKDLRRPIGTLVFLLLPDNRSYIGDVRLFHKDRFSRETGRVRALEQAMHKAKLPVEVRQGIWASYKDRASQSGPRPPVAA